MEISLLSDTGIQFYDGEIVLDLSKRINNPLFFYQNEEQDFFNGTKKVVLHSLYRDKNTDCFYPYSLLNFDENGQLLTTNFTTIKPINEDDIIIVKDISKILNNYQEEWLPIPYFNKNQLNGQYLFGPSGWARLYLKIEEKSQNSLKIKYTLSFDTTIGKQNDEHESRILLHEIDTNEGYNKFGLCSDIHNNMRFLNNDSKNEWVDDALKIISKKNKHGNVNSLDYSAEYLFLIHYLSSNDLLPNVFLHKSNQHDYINVDLILDIGNSRTCGLIFEDSMADGSFNFTSVKKLEIRNISQPWEVYDDPFSMNLTLHKAKIGNYSIPGFSKIFSWPSILRIGKEAQILLNKYDVSQFIFDEPLNTLSSPKRYLWDKDISTKYWEFISLDNKKAGHASYDGLTGYMSPGGEVLDKPTNAYSTWSKSSMMVFVYIEILNHVYAQINSFKFRSDVDGEIKKLRKLRSIVITCPTAMTEFEQFELRESARKAVLIIDKYTKDIQSEFNEPDSMGFNFSSLVEKPIIYTEGNGDSIQIIPRPKDISTADDETNKRLDWIYDEASCSQINFIYAEVAKKYANNFKAFFEIYGQGNSKQNLKVATLDIGGGTSDLVITQYSYDSNNALPYLTPDPLFYETYNIAGDDLLKEVIHQVLIDGAEKFEKKTFGIGQIRQYAERIGCPNVSDLILHFFGEHAGFMGAQHRYYRKYFVKQVLLPIANKILEYAKGEKPENKVFSFDDVFLDNPPNDSLINYINKIFGGSFDFKAIEWEFSVERINAIIEYRFKDLFKQISFILKSFNCDFFLLTGKPSEIKHIRSIFVNEYPEKADRIISFANYQVGTWYPFTNAKGYITDPKTSVAVGAMVYTLANRFNKIHGFKLDSNILKTKLLSNANFIGNYNPSLKNLDKIFLSPSKNDFTIEKTSIPIYIGIKQFENSNYPTKPIFKLDFNKVFLKERLESSGIPESQLNVALEEEVSKLRQSMFTIQISRNYEVSKEEIKIEVIEEFNGLDSKEKNSKLLCFRFVPSNFINEYWLDNGEFKILTH